MNQENMQAMLQQMQTGNPKMQLFAQLMEQQSKNNEKPQVNTKLKGQLNKMVDLNKRLKKKLQMLQKEREQLLEYLDFFLQINSELSGAVGACPCWGLDDNCECQQLSNPKGIHSGGPGTHPINQEYWNIYVAPALQQAEQKQVETT